MNKTQLLVALTIFTGYSVSFGAQVDPKNTLALMTSAARKAELQERSKNRENLIEEQSYQPHLLAGRNLHTLNNTSGGVLITYTMNGEDYVMIGSEAGDKDTGTYGPHAGNREDQEKAFDTVVREFYEEIIADESLNLATADVKDFIKEHTTAIIAQEVGRSPWCMATTHVVKFDAFAEDFPQAFYTALAQEKAKQVQREGYTGKALLASCLLKDYKEAVGLGKYGERIFVDANIHDKDGSATSATIELRQVAHNQLKLWALGVKPVLGVSGYDDNQEVQYYGYKTNEKNHYADEEAAHVAIYETDAVAFAASKKARDAQAAYTKLQQEAEVAKENLALAKAQLQSIRDAKAAK